MASDTSTNRTDALVSLIKGIVGLAPFVGPLAEEVVGIIIPNQRLDRLAKLVQLLEGKVEGLDRDLLKVRFLIPGFVDLFEEGLYRAARAISEDRLDQIAALLKNGLSDEGANFAQYKYILSLLSELNDVELLILQAYNVGWVGDFVEENLAVLRPPLASFGSPRDIIENATIHDSYEPHLVRLNLLKPHFNHNSSGLPVFDSATGMMKSQGYTITALGRLLLKYVDRASADSANQPAL